MALAPRAGVDSFTSRLMQTKDYEPSVLREVIEAQEQAHLPAWSRPLTDLLKKWVVTGTVDAKATCLSMDAACAAAEALDGPDERRGRPGRAGTGPLFGQAPSRASSITPRMPRGDRASSSSLRRSCASSSTCS